jgi:hypothetical protein
MARAMEKNGVAAPLPLLVMTNALLVSLEAGFLGGPPLLAAGTGALAIATSYVLARWLGLSRWPALVPFLGMVLLVTAMFRSGLLALARGGVLWRGTLYPTAEVRVGNRIGFA